MFFYKQTKKESDVQRVLLRIINGTTQVKDYYDMGERIESRRNMSLVVLVIPFDGGRFLMGDAFATVTRDLSSRGMALFVNRPIPTEELVIGMSGDSGPIFFHAKVCSVKRMEGGFSLVGVYVIELLDPHDHPPLKGLTPFTRELDDSTPMIPVSSGGA